MPLINLPDRIYHHDHHHWAWTRRFNHNLSCQYQLNGPKIHQRTVCFFRIFSHDKCGCWNGPTIYNPWNIHCICSAAYRELPYDVLNSLACQILHHMLHIYKLKSNLTSSSWCLSSESLWLNCLLQFSQLNLTLSSGFCLPDLMCLCLLWQCLKLVYNTCIQGFHSVSIYLLLS